MDVVDVLILSVASFAAGLVNAAAGGGTLISFPALVFAGYSTKVANVTNRIGLLPGYLGGSLAYKNELARQPRNLALVAGPTVVGAIVGSVLLLSTPVSTFDLVVPFLVIGACGLLLFQERIASFLNIHPGSHPRVLLLTAGMFVAAAYGAYFGGGLGIILLGVLGILLPDDLQRSNALKGVTSLLITVLASAYFAIFAEIAWPAAALMAVISFAGGYFGVALAKRVSPRLLRLGVVVYGLTFAVILLVRAFT